MQFNNKSVVLNRNEADKLMRTMNHISNQLLTMQVAVTQNRIDLFKHNFYEACKNADVLDTNFTYKMEDHLK